MCGRSSVTKALSAMLSPDWTRSRKSRSIEKAMVELLNAGVAKPRMRPDACRQCEPRAHRLGTTRQRENGYFVRPLPLLDRRQMLVRVTTLRPIVATSSSRLFRDFSG